MKPSQIDYSALDRREVLSALFHPRKDYGAPDSKDVLIPVEGEAVVGARFHMTAKTAPCIIFFHGNGEIASDYDDFASIYNRSGINFLAADYRGYGRSTGSPTVTAMMKDCHTILDFVKNWLKDNGYSGPLIVKGRSLGSASALELAATRKEEIGGLIIESGFAHAAPLLKLLGVNVAAIGFDEKEGFRNTDKIRAFDKPTLIIHAERDFLIPVSEAQTLFDASQAANKALVKIPNAGHNDIFSHGMSQYISAVKALVNSVSEKQVLSKLS
jgi:fermentation-respiration switch protein FrsA (DUF1100 family)